MSIGDQTKSRPYPENTPKPTPYPAVLMPAKSRPEQGLHKSSANQQCDDDFETLLKELGVSAKNVNSVGIRLSLLL